MKSEGRWNLTDMLLICSFMLPAYIDMSMKLLYKCSYRFLGRNRLMHVEFNPESITLPMIHEVRREELQECLDVIHESFGTA